MVPQKLVPYFKKSFQRKDSDAELIGGDICCCSSNRFEIRYIGEIKRGLFTKAFLYSENSEIAVEACCEKCNSDSFAISIKYEYPNERELDDLEISEADRAFTWIWVSLKCNKCGAKYKKFVEFETS